MFDSLRGYQQARPWTERYRTVKGDWADLAIGNFYVTSIDELSDHPRHHSSSGACTSKQVSGWWTYNASDSGVR